MNEQFSNFIYASYSPVLSRRLTHVCVGVAFWHLHRLNVMVIWLYMVTFAGLPYFTVQL